MHQRFTCTMFLLLCVAGLLLHPAGEAVAAGNRQPNIVLLIGDDHGWPYSGFMGDRVVHTPNLDALAAAGTVFTQGQTTSSVCAPSLRALLAGIHTDQWDEYRTAVEALVGPQPPRTDVAYYWTVPRALAWQGYVTWEGGKFWEGTFDQAGFSQGMATGIASDFYSSVGDHFGRDGWSEGRALEPLRSFLDTTGERPFFAWLAPMLPHAPFDAPEEFQALYRDRGLTPQEAGYYANVSWLDAFVGGVLHELDARGLRDDTLVIYLTDNGAGIHQPIAGIGPGKGTLAELGFRTPIVVSWPGHVPAGRVRRDLVSELDVPATILDYAGADPISGGDSRSLRSALESGVPVGRDKIIGHYRGATRENSGYYVRTPVWRYTRARDGSERLYEIARDPLEQSDVAPLHPDLLTRFRADALIWQAKLALPTAELQAAGRLTDDAGRPLSGEGLRLYGRSTAGADVNLQVRTAPNGDFRFLAVPHGSYTLHSQHGAPLRLGSLSSGNIPVTLPLGGLGSYYPLRTDPRPGRTTDAAGRSSIRGDVRDERGRPLSGKTVIVRSRDRKDVTVVVLSGADGRYRAESLPAGTYEVTAIVDDRRSRPRDGVKLDGSETTTTLDIAVAGEPRSVAAVSLRDTGHP